MIKYAVKLIIGRGIFCKSVQFAFSVEEKSAKCECSKQAFVRYLWRRKSLCFRKLLTDREVQLLVLQNTKYIHTREIAVFRRDISCIARKGLKVTVVHLPGLLWQSSGPRHADRCKMEIWHIKYISDGKRSWCYCSRYLKFDEMFPVVDSFYL